MIAFKSNRPVLQVGAGFITDYGLAWLGDAFEEAASLAGTTLPFKNDLVASVMHYLEESCDLDVMPIDELYCKIKRMLNEVGLAHIADNLPLSLPPYQVNVAEIAEKNPLPLFFVNELREELTSLGELGLTNYQFTDIKECVLALQGKKKWTKACERMLADIEFLLSRYTHNDAA